MNIKKTSDLLLNFAIKRLAEIFGILVSLTGLMLFLSLITYSPNDPNFIFPENTKIENLIGFQGSFISDLFFQSVGIMAYLIPLTFLVTGINILRSKDFFLFIENNFFTILYLIFGALFFGYYYSDTYSLYINGNSGFVGEYLNKSFLGSTISINENIFFYILILITIIFFLISVNFNPKKFFEFIKKTYDLTNKRNTKNYTDKSEIINEYIPQDEIKNLIQEDLPFIKSENKSELKIKFKLPGLDLLKIPTKKERENFEKNEDHDPEFLEKILMDFGVNGNIKKVSHGPVVTLNEFEPAAGVKVSKIINLSDDIARNTSSESARIATIPGSNTVGIELPNNIRENVYLSEILANSDFKKREIKLPIALGKNISGKPVVGDLTSMPHLLIAGTTGSGKSVCINTIILSLLYRHTPENCKFILIDPKMLELSTYEGIPHLLCPVITEAKKAASVLGWVVKEMESRYRLMTKEGVRNIDGYNKKHKLPMPYIVVVVDEMSDLNVSCG
jgi:S-DNA-T family DNA segregation ATPase FtsK/SpoIIIE